MFWSRGLRSRSRAGVGFTTAIVISGVLIAGTHSVNASADALSDLVSRLHTLNASTTVAGALEVQSSKVGHKVKDGKPDEPARLQIHIDTGDGLGIHLDNRLLQTVEAEQQAHADDPEKPTPVTDLLRSTGPIAIERMVSAAPDLWHALDGATAAETKAVTYEGSPVQELTVNVPLHASRKDKSNISDYRGTMSIWLDAQGMLLAYRQIYHAKFCKFFLCLSIDETRNGKLRNLDGRLITISFSDEVKQSGLGQDGDTLTSYTFKPSISGNSVERN